MMIMEEEAASTAQPKKDSGDGNGDGNANSDGSLDIGQIFDTVAGWIRESGRGPTTGRSWFSGGIGSDTKLRLYGLYKHVTVGSCDTMAAAAPSMLRVEAYAKYQSWLACQDLTTVEAMEEYVAAVASIKENSAWERQAECQELWQSYCKNKNSCQVTEESDKGYGESNKEKGQKLAPTKNEEDWSFVNEKYTEFQGEEEEEAGCAPSLLPPTSFLEKSLGLPRLIPRGQLDISYTHLIQTLLDCLFGLNTMERCTALDKDIAALWKQQIDQEMGHDDKKKLENGRGKTEDPTRNQTHAVSNDDGDDENKRVPATTAIIQPLVGLSVRSLLDLFLMAKQYPPGSQIILAPALSVPGMLHVLEYHELEVVGIDISSSSNVDDDDDHRVDLGIDCNAIRKKITSRTRAILVVHAFGKLCAAPSDWQALRALADEHEGVRLDLLEDCAQVYTGLHHQERQKASPMSSCGYYLGAPQADVSFFSFGLIKTSTAVGGGMAIVRQGTSSDDGGDLLWRKMNRIQWSAYTRQSKYLYLKNVIKALVFRLLSQSPYVFVWVNWLLTLCWGPNALDKCCECWLRGFGKLPNNYDKDKTTSTIRSVSYMQRIRQKPCAQLLNLLWKRFRDDCLSTAVPRGITTQERVQKRIDQGRKIISNLSRFNPFLLVLDDNGGSDSQKPWSLWLFPVRRPKNVKLEWIRRQGFDVARSISQLACVNPQDCPLLAEIMNDIVYLPSTTLLSSPRDLHNLVACLSSPCLARDSKDIRKQPEKWSVLWRFSLIGLFVYRFRSFLVPLASWAASIAGILVVFVFLIQWSIAGFYLDHSHAFAKYCCLICDDPQTLNCEAPRVIESLECLKIPECDENTVPKHGRSVFIIGATGFIGSMILYDILKHRKELGLSTIYILCRPKRSKSAADRVTSLLSDRMFSFVPAEELRSTVKVIAGDVTEPDLGCSAEDRDQLLDDPSITHVFHCAAVVNFTQSLGDAAMCNIFGPLTVQRLTSRMINKSVTLVHLSTAFVHGSKTGSRDHPLGENLFDFEDYDPVDLYESMLGSQYLASRCYNDMGFHNTYTFSKCICEHLLCKEAMRHGLKTIVIRPSIVGPAVQYPFESWCGKKPSTFVAAACLYLQFQWNLWYFGPQTVPCFPVDVLSRFVLHKAGFFIEVANKQQNYHRTSGTNSKNPDQTTNMVPRFFVHNAAWDAASPPCSQFTWLYFAVTVTHLGVYMDYFSRLTAYVGLFVTKKILPTLRPTREVFKKLHSFLVVGPFSLVLATAELFGLEISNAREVMPFLDLPLLFYPFATSSYYFHSELVAPAQLCGERYAFQSAVAAHLFSTKADKRTCARPGMSFKKLIRGTSSPWASDLAWALTQPRGRIAERLAAWVLAIVFRCVCSDITVDVKSFSRSVSKAQKMVVILAPTHRSFFDFLLISYICFSIPELQLDLPVIATASEFAGLPLLGWALQFFRMFYVMRGRGKYGREEASEQVRRCLNGNASVLEVYLEGTRSRDRRFVAPKTGLLKCIHATNPGCVVVPIAINYERIPEQRALSLEACGEASRGLKLCGLFSWLMDAFIGNVSLGRIHVVAGSSFGLADFSSDGCRTAAIEAQKRQRDLVLVSPFHVRAVASVLDLPSKTVQACFRRLRCHFWPHETAISQMLGLPDDISETWTIALQAAHVLEPLIRSDLPLWSSWLSSVPVSFVDDDILSLPEVEMVRVSLCAMFVEAKEAVQRAKLELQERGFSHPSVDHVLQIASASGGKGNRHLILLNAAAAMLGIDSRSRTMYRKTDSSVLRHSILPSLEKLGFWGFHDTSFVLRSETNGRYHVSVTGDRYSYRNKRFSRLIPFIEQSVQVKIDFSEGSNLTGIADADVYVSNSALNEEEIGSLCTICHEISMSTEDRVRHGTGHALSDVYTIRRGCNIRVPDAVVWPSCTGEIQSLVALSIERNWCLIPYGGGTNVSQAVCCPSLTQEPRPILSVDMRRMNQIISLDIENNLVHAQAGITGLELLNELRCRGYCAGHEPDSLEFSTLGGWIATKASGMKRNKYGNIEDIVVGVEVVGSNGLVSHGHWGRESCGLDLKTLMLGSEGCLGIIVNAVLRVQPIPDVCDHDAILLPDFETGLQLLKDISRLPISLPASVRLLDNDHFQLGRALRPEPETIYEQVKEAASFALFRYFKFSETRAVCLAIGYEGSSDEVRRQKQLISRLARSFGGISLGPDAGKSSYDMTFMIAYLRDFALTFQIAGESFETFAPWSQLESIVCGTKKCVNESHRAKKLPGKPFVGCRVTQIYSDGVCLYFYLCISVKGIEDPLSVFAYLEHIARAEILKRGGSLSHHHGVGKLRAKYLPLVRSPAAQKISKSIKDAMDPSNIFGAGNGYFSLENCPTS